MSGRTRTGRGAVSIVRKQFRELTMRYTEPTQWQERAWAEWVASRPSRVRAIAERFDPWTLYQMQSTGQRVTVCSISEDGTVTVAVTGQFNLVMFDRQVFGVNPNDLVSCALPGADESLGTALSSDDVADNLDRLRVMVRPDLWELDAHGKAQRRG